jgi:alpha-N-arabinofuranosidase
MANLAQLVNVIAPIFTNKEGLFLQPIYFPIAEYAKQKGNISLDALVESPKYKAGNRGELGYLDASVTWNQKERALYVNVLNRSASQDITARIENVEGRLAPAADFWQMYHDDLKATHTFGDDKRVRPRAWRETLKLERNGFAYRFPKHSLTIIRIPLEP